MSSIQSVLSERELNETNITIKNFKSLTCENTSPPNTGVETKARPKSYVKTVPDYNLSLPDDYLLKSYNPYANVKIVNRERLNSDLDLNEKNGPSDYNSQGVKFKSRRRKRSTESEKARRKQMAMAR